MEIATGMVGAALALLGIILAYIWRANGRNMQQIQEGLRRLQEGQETMARQLMQGQKELMEGQKEIARGIGEIAKMAQETLREVRAKG
jgi:preprotein translocase subunit YajC